SENAHPVLGEQTVPALVAQPRIDGNVTQQKQEVDGQHDSGNPLGHPVIQTRTRKVGDIGYHIQTPARTISTTEMARTIFEPSFPPSSVSPIPRSMIRWRIPATRWYSNADSSPQITSLASGLVRQA